MLALMLAGLAVVTAPAPIAAQDAHVTRVTVYADRAEVVREATARVPEGPSQVAFAGIPVGVDPDSIRIAARGVPARIGAADAEVKRIERELAAKERREFDLAYAVRWPKELQVQGL